MPIGSDHRGEAPPEIDLAREADFTIGLARVSPATRQFTVNGADDLVEPRVMQVLVAVARRRGEVVSRDELIATCWGGRVVGEDAIQRAVAQARKLGAKSGAFAIETIARVGYRLIASAESAEAPKRSRPDDAPDIARPSIAVLPFHFVGADAPHAAIADALAYDLITELSLMRWLFVIARGSSFQFRGPAADIDRVRTVLSVRYCLSGTVEIVGGALIVSVELCDTHDRGIVWSDRYRAAPGGVHEIREQIVRAIINALELHIPINEARRARLKSPEDLDAWAAYHLGLQHMYRFTKADNAKATTLFQRAAALEPDFARAYAGLSFTHFQDAFLRYTDDVSEAGKLARHFAELSLERDPVDPFANFTMGRAFWLQRDLDASLPWLDRANTLNPNYAQAKYSRAWTESLLGQGAESRADVDAALALSPLDPLRYGMLAVRAFSHIVEGEDVEAAAWAERAAHSPGAHALIELIAAATHGLNGDNARAQAWAASARAREPALTRDEFFRAFPFRDAPTQKRISETLERHGF